MHAYAPVDTEVLVEDVIKEVVKPRYVFSLILRSIPVPRIHDVHETVPDSGVHCVLTLVGEVG